MATREKSKPIEVAPDTNVLLDLADENEVVLDCFKTISERVPDAIVVILPTVIEELSDIADSGDTEEEKKLALTALQSIRHPWNFCPINCIPVGHGIVEQTGRKIRAKGLLPDEEENDSFIIAEAGLREVSILLSSDSHIKDIDRDVLKLLLDGCDIGCPLIASPWQIVNKFFLKK